MYDNLNEVVKVFVKYLLKISFEDLCKLYVMFIYMYYLINVDLQQEIVFYVDDFCCISVLKKSMDLQCFVQQVYVNVLG